MRIYVAGASKEIDLCEHWIKQLRLVGHEISHDWTIDIRTSKPDALLSYDQRRRYAIKDMSGVRSSDMVWLLVPRAESTGAWTEFGLALAYGIPVVVSGEHAKNIFCEIPLWRFADHCVAFEFFRTEAERAVSVAGLQ